MGDVGGDLEQMIHIHLHHDEYRKDCLMEMPSMNSDAMARYETLLALVEELGGLRGKMFGMPSFKYENGKFFGGLFEDDMVFKVTDPGYREELLDLPGATLLDPAGGRPMKEWVRLGPEYEDRYADIIRHILAG